MSGKLMGQIYGLKLSPSKRDVLLAMAENANDDGSGCAPGVPFIAWKIGISERQVQRIQKALVTDKILIIVATPVRKAVEYRIDISAGTPKPAYVPRGKNKGDILSQKAPPKGDKMTQTDGDILSEKQGRVTSHGKDENAEGDITTGKTASTHKDKRIKDQPNRARGLRKDFDDVPKSERLEIIRAWADNLAAPPIGAYKSEANHRTAAEIFREGYRAAQVALFVREKKADSYWRGKTLTLTKVGELMPEWLLSRTPKAHNGVTHPLIDPNDRPVDYDPLTRWMPNKPEYTLQ